MARKLRVKPLTEYGESVENRLKKLGVKKSELIRLAGISTPGFYDVINGARSGEEVIPKIERTLAVLEKGKKTVV